MIDLEVKVYLDEILVETFEDHLKTIHEVFTIISKAKHQVNVVKFKFAALEMEYQ